MPRGPSESHIFNNYISGGIGGHGGGGGVQGLGGSGGSGEGPRLRYDINAGYVTMNNLHGEAGIHILHRAIALEALYDAAESFPQPKCHPKTRMELLDNLNQWATARNSNSPILWLHGPAGAGKSAVMQTLCQRLHDNGQLGASFFFKRGHNTRGNAKMLFATLAYQLALYQHELRVLISQSVEQDPSALARGMDTQLSTLILEPYKLLQEPTLLVLLIDGLDECEGHDIQRQILRIIRSAFNNHCLRFRIIIASRPEPHIRETFKEESFHGLFYSVNIEQSFEDIQTYLRNEFSRICREHPTMRNIPTLWPSPEILEMLVRKSSGYFIYASTVIKFIDDEYSRPSKQLDIIRNLAPHDFESPFKALDQLYIQILSTVPARHHPHLCDILSVIINYPAKITVEEIDDTLGLEPGQVSLILRALHSLLKLPSDQDHNRQLGVHHASFLDFLKSEERSSNFHVGSAQHRAKLARSILHALAYAYDNPEKNRAWLQFHGTLSQGWLEYIASEPPSAEFVPLVEQINPVFIFCNEVSDVALENFSFWLKKIRGVPKDLILRWEDYRFILWYEDCQRRLRLDLLRVRDELSLERDR
ncbi:putative nwd2 protein [Mycena venus]|uniref:Putative nwd2 protein n=1 Tax=Mycena venus TaxID=2733690 RepID=A0A8H7D3Z6_9AGAR|nr:putative nwd2 protein [Mycena venus]